MKRLAINVHHGPIADFDEADGYIAADVGLYLNQDEARSLAVSLVKWIARADRDTTDDPFIYKLRGHVVNLDGTIPASVVRGPRGESVGNVVASKYGYEALHGGTQAGHKAPKVLGTS